MGSSSSSASCSHRFPRKEKAPKCGYQATESVCATCLCCVSCPVAILCCFVRTSSKIGQCTVRNARARGCCGVQKRRIHAAYYSSFSDSDSDSPPARSRGCSKDSSAVKSSLVRHRDNGMRKDQRA